MFTRESYHIIGVDGGGSGCRVRIIDGSGAAVGAADGGPANFTTDPKQTIGNVREAIERAAQEASLTGAQLRSSIAHVGLAGIMRKADSQEMASSLPFERVQVTDDRVTSATGALGQSDGVLAAIGTGSFVAARKEGNLRFFGGWGLQIADQASGAWLGRAALEHSLLVNDGLEKPSPLTQDILTQFGNDPVELVAFAGIAQPTDYAKFAPLVVEAGKSGEKAGQSLMKRGADYLNSCFAAARLADGDIICLTGGVGPHYEAYLDRSFQDRITPPQGSALDGALELARQELSKMETST